VLAPLWWRHRLWVTAHPGQHRSAVLTIHCLLYCLQPVCLLLQLSALGFRHMRIEELLEHPNIIKVCSAMRNTCCCTSGLETVQQRLAGVNSTGSHAAPEASLNTCVLPGCWHVHLCRLGWVSQQTSMTCRGTTVTQQRESLR
jgi:hypothetical protein